VSLIWLPLCKYCQHHQRKTTWTTFVTQVVFMVIHLRTASNAWKSLPYAHMFLNKTSIPRTQMIVTFNGVYRFALKGIGWSCTIIFAYVCLDLQSRGFQWYCTILKFTAGAQAAPWEGIKELQERRNAWEYKVMVPLSQTVFGWSPKLGSTGKVSSLLDEICQVLTYSVLYSCQFLQAFC